MFTVISILNSLPRNITTDKQLFCPDLKHLRTSQVIKLHRLHQARTMPDQQEDLARLMSHVTLTQPTRAIARNETDERESIVYDDVAKLASITPKLGIEVNKAQILCQDSDTLLSSRIAAIGLVLKRSAEIAKLADSLENATVENIMSRLMSFGDGEGDVRKLLLHFEHELKAIVKDTYDDAGWDQNSMVRILEACHNQALRGDLHVDNYFAPLYEANLASPYDPDFESEAYYEHENRVEVDDDYAEAESARRQRRSGERIENEKRTNRAWIRFWVRMLHGCQGGPTLFWPYSDDDKSEDLPDVPRYLFRAFDAASSGKSDENIVASSASTYAKDTCRTDLLSLELEKRTERLCTHLKKKCSGETDCADNLMSWSSSLLFVLQYAIWRHNKGHRSSADVQICVVDTTKFPRGQFARDMWLLEQCRDDRTESSKVQNEIRLRKLGYDNGEYLSQGLLVHQHRSAVFTLEKIIQSGLHELCPEFDEFDGNQKWTNRVCELRLAWAQPQSTFHEELHIASRIATRCFENFHPCELAICLLTLKNRRLESEFSAGTLPLAGRYEDLLNDFCRRARSETRLARQ